MPPSPPCSLLRWEDKTAMLLSTLWDVLTCLQAWNGDKKKAVFNCGNHTGSGSWKERKWNPIFLLFPKLLHCIIFSPTTGHRETYQKAPLLPWVSRKATSGWVTLRWPPVCSPHCAPCSIFLQTLCDNLIKTQALGFGCRKCKWQDQNNLLPVPFLWSNSKLVVSIQFVIMTVFNHGVYSAARCRIEVTHATIQA